MATIYPASYSGWNLLGERYQLPDQPEAGDVLRQREEISRLREREAATREILQLISTSHDDEQPVFDAILRKALDLCGATAAGLVLGHQSGPPQRLVAHLNTVPEIVAMYDTGQIPMDPDKSAAARAILTGEVIHLEDMGNSRGYQDDVPYLRRMVDEHGVRTNLLVPLMGRQGGIGALILYKRVVAPFSEDEIALVQAFAAQAVIVIENVGQFRAVETANAELETRLEREAATSEILQVISQNRNDEQPVFDAILESALRLCGAPLGLILLGGPVDTHLRPAAQKGGTADWMEELQDNPPPREANASLNSQAAIECRVVHVEDIRDTELYRSGQPLRRKAVDQEGMRTSLALPLVSGGMGIGTICLYRREVRPFSEQQISILQSFAAQAVIAIENVRQFRAIQSANSELEARLEREAATREILEVISTSRDDEKPVFDVIIENARRLCEANMAAFVLGEEGGGPQVMVANRGATEETLKLYRNGNFPMDPEVSLAAQAIITRQTIHLHDMRDTDAYRDGHPNFVSLVDQQGIRTNLLVPLIAQGRGIGCLILFRTEARPYSDDQIALVETFVAQAVIAIENVRQFKALEASNAELAVSLERQTATADVLDMISQAQTDVQPVFDIILQAASRLCEAPFAGLYLADEKRSEVRQVASLGARSVYLNRPDTAWPLSNPASVPRSVAERRVIHVEDLADTDLYRAGDRERVAAVDLEGMRTYLAVPLRHGDHVLGCIGLYRREPLLFGDDQIALVESFAAQAVIAIENVRQFRELQTRLEREKASRGILDVISQSREDEQPVFDVILENSARLCNAQLALLAMANEDRTQLSLAAHKGDSFPEFVGFFRDTPLPLDASEAETARAVLECTTIQIEDLRSGELFERGQPHRMTAIEKGGVRTLLIVPLISNGVGLGAITLWRSEVSPFSEDEIALVEGFAAQAVIAIENVRQFRELQTRLKREQATGEVLSVINRSRDDQHPVFRTILESASRLCDAPLAMFGVVDETRNRMVVDAYLGAGKEYIDALNRDGLPLDDPRQAAIRAITTGEAVQILDMREDELYRAGLRSRTLSVDMEGIRTFLAVPIISGDRGLGVIVVFRREVRAFDEDQISLLKSFAAQAAIAIENARQFQELQSRLEREAASREILGVISESRDDEKPVFDAILKNASNLCDAPFAALVLGRKGDAFQTLAANIGDSSETIELYQSQSVPMDPEVSYAARAICECRVIHLHDLGASQYYGNGSPTVRALVDEEGVATVLFVPLIAGDQAIGVITLFRREVEPFDERNIDVVETFAAQAVIAIENVRQFQAIQSANAELNTRLEREEATREVLQVISKSRDDEKPVFDTILKQARNLCGSPHAFLFLRDDADTHLEIVSHSGARSEFIEILKANPQPLDDPNSHSARAVFHNQVVHIEDLSKDEFSDQPTPQRRTAIDVEGMRTLLIVPLVSGDRAIGAILLYRREVAPFAGDEIALVQGFAAQAVIAIENSHQLQALVEARDAAEAALTDLQKAQERLIQSEKMASLGQLTAGIAHEIKNPLNFVNNFAKLSDELLAELREILEDKIKSLDGEEREDAEDLFRTVRENLGKINEHGQRADSIIKNMLLHSREGPSERQRRALNPIVAEALNLAYHGARAENSSFNIDMQTDLAADAGEIDCYPQDLMRVFLNLISNGMYAAHKRSLSEDGFSPVISVTSRLNGDRIEVEVRDNGMGIPDDLREKIFTPFFTTKPAGEGTGLGLSLSYDIVVKQHGGDLTVDSEPGQFTVFRTSFPRTLPANIGGET